MEATLLEVKSLTKTFPGVKALSGVSLTLNEGEVLGICGENGAGKSTLIKCLCGVYQPNEGEIYFQGEKVAFANAEAALNKGISVIYQELSVAPTLDIAQNIFIGRLPQKGGMINFQKLFADSEVLSRNVGLKRDVRTRVSELNISEKQLVEIAKAMSRNPKVLIMDEPTSSLGQDDSKRLFELIRDLKNQGYGIIFISHHMEEIFEITDRVLVLRDGKTVEDRPTSEWTVDDLVFAMVNRKVDNQFPTRQTEVGNEICLEVESLSNRFLRDVSFNVKNGEIVGLAGIVGAGRSEVLKSVYGAYGKSDGVIKMHGKPVSISSPTDGMKHRIGFMSEDRKNDMLNLGASIRDNIVMPYYKKYSKYGFVNKADLKRVALERAKKFSVKMASIESKVEQLSGGNMQKVILGRITEGEPDLMLLDEPTRGIDVSVKQDIYRDIVEFADQGKAVLLVTSELPELLGLADRIYVMRNHTIVKELKKEEIDQETVMFYATGGSLV